MRRWTELKDTVKRNLGELAKSLNNGPFKVLIPIRVTAPAAVPAPAAVFIPTRNTQWLGNRYFPTSPYGIRRFISYKSHFNIASIAYKRDPLMSLIYRLASTPKAKGNISIKTRILTSVRFPVFGRINGHYVIGIKKVPKISVMSFIKSITTFDDSRFYNALTRKFESNGCMVELELPQSYPHGNDLLSVIDNVHQTIQHSKLLLLKLVQLNRIGNLPTKIQGNKLEVRFENLNKTETSNLLVDHNIDYIKITPMNNSNHVSKLNKQLLQEPIKKVNTFKSL